MARFYPAKVSVVNLTTNLGGFINTYLDLNFKNLAEFIISQNFENVTEGIVFADFRINSNTYTVLNEKPDISEKNKKKILYVYLTGQENPILKDKVNHKFTNTAPENYIFFNNFKDSVNVMLHIENIRRYFDKYKDILYDDIINRDACDDMFEKINGNANIFIDFIRMIGFAGDQKRGVQYF